MTRFSVLALIVLACAACSRDSGQASAQSESQSTQAVAGCIAGGGGYLQAQLRGALVADLDWRNADMQCEGGLRPDGKGVRVTIAGPLPAAEGAAPRQLRFIFGIDPRDIAPGVAQALPTNVTVILEGGQQLFATQGDGHCAVELLERQPLAPVGGRKRDRVHARGYCLDPATTLAGDARLLVPTFEFTGVANTELDP
jgi:hypothetical protein